MEFVIGREEFRRALERVQGVVDRRSSILLLSNVLLRAKGQRLHVTASDMEIAFSGEYDCQVLDEGAMTLQAKYLYDVVCSLPLETVHVRTLDNDAAEITSGKAYFKLMGLSPDGYPDIPHLENATEFSLPASILMSMITHTFFSIATDDSRYGLNGAFLERLPTHEGGGLRMVSTDGHRLSMCGYPDCEPEIASGMLFPRKGMSELKKFCTGLGDASIDVAVTANAAVFSHGTMMLYMRMLEGDFPNYRQVIPQTSQREIVVNRDALTRSLKRIVLLANEKTHSVRVAISDDRLALSASSPDMGDAREDIDAEVKGDNLVIGFNAAYLLDAVGSLGGETIQILFGDSFNPCEVLSAEKPNVSYIVMPMRLE